MKHSFPSKLRRLLALMLALALVIGLTGCFQKEEPETPSEDPTAPTQTEPVEETPTDAPTEAPDNTPTLAPTEPPQAPDEDITDSPGGVGEDNGN